MHAVNGPAFELPVGGLGLSFCETIVTHAQLCSWSQGLLLRSVLPRLLDIHPHPCCAGFTDIGALCTRGAVTRGKGCCCISTLSCKGFVKCKWKKSCCDNCDSGFSDTG